MPKVVAQGLYTARGAHRSQWRSFTKEAYTRISYLNSTAHPPVFLSADFLVSPTRWYFRDTSIDW